MKQTNITEAVLLGFPFYCTILQPSPENFSDGFTLIPHPYYVNMKCR